jgi:hypothetical protein
VQADVVVRPQAHQALARGRITAKEVLRVHFQEAQGRAQGQQGRRVRRPQANAGEGLR